MQSQQFENYHILRIDKGEEAVATIKEYVAKMNITLGTVSGIGATNNATIGLFDIAKKQYFSKTLQEDLEITSLTGNISTQDGKPYLHLHATLADANQNCFGGHLNSCTISATCEVCIVAIVGKVERLLDETIGLNLMKFL